MMMKYTLLLVVLLSIWTCRGQGECCLCGDDCPNVHSTKYGFNVDDGLSLNLGVTSCIALDYRTTTALESGTNSCSAYRDAYGECCCTSTTQCRSVDDDEGTPAPGNGSGSTGGGGNIPAGTHSFCAVCENGQFPRLPNVVMAISYWPGNPTCADMYWFGRTNNIPDSLCYPLQILMRTPCGCLPADTTPVPTPATQPNPAPTQPRPFVAPKVPGLTSRNDFKIGVVGLTSDNEFGDVS